MASVFYNEAKRAIAAGEIDLNADDIRVQLLMTNTTADTQNDGVVNINNSVTGTGTLTNNATLGTGNATSIGGDFSSSGTLDFDQRGI